MRFTSIKDKLTSMFTMPELEPVPPKSTPDLLLPMYDWKFGSRSLKKLEGVDDRLVRVAHLALRHSSIDFGITCGMRTKAEQAQLVREGKSKTMNSRHLSGMAVDIVCYKGGRVTWALGDYVVAAQSFAHAARTLDVTVRWGAAWHTTLNETDSKQSMDDYVDLRTSQGRKPFIDGPHFEIPKRINGAG